MNQKEQTFRKVALERLSSPEQLDILLQVITPSAWLLWLPLAGLVLAGLLWGLFGVVPTTVSGRAILLQQGGLLEVSSLVAGRVQSLQVGLGSRLKKGQTIAIIAQPELAERERQALEQLQELERQQAGLLEILAEGNDLNHASRRQQEASLHQQMRTAHEKIKFLQDRIAAQEGLLTQGLITSQALRANQTELANAQLEISQLQAQLQQLSLKNLEQRKTSKAELTQVENQVAQARRQLASLQQQAGFASKIHSQYAGRVVEIRVAPGSIVQQGMSLLTIEPENDGGQNAALEVAIYISAADGKKISPGMAVHVSPSTVRREEYGYMLGQVRFVSDYPASAQSMRITLQNDELVKELSGASSPIEMRASLQKAATPSGYQWSSQSGPSQKISAGTQAQVDIVIRKQAPITLLIPALAQFLEPR